MSRYRKVLSRIWSDEKFISLSSDAQLLFLYHLTSDRTTPFLLYVEGPGAMSDALRMPSPRLRQGMDDVLSKGMVWYAKDGSNLVFLPNALKLTENAPESPNAVKAWVKLCCDLPKTDFYYKCLCHWQSLKQGITHALTHAFHKALPMPPVQEQEQEQIYIPPIVPLEETLPSSKPKSEKPQAEVKSKEKFIDYVFLTPEEHERLKADFGVEGREALIAELDNYIGSNPKKRSKMYTDHNRVLRGWVAEKLGLKKSNGKPVHPDTNTTFDPDLGEIR